MLLDKAKSKFAMDLVIVPNPVWKPDLWAILKVTNANFRRPNSVITAFVFFYLLLQPINLNIYSSSKFWGEAGCMIMQNMGNNHQRINGVKLDLGRQLFCDWKVKFLQTLLICCENPPEKYMVSLLTYFKSIIQKCHVEIVIRPRKFPGTSCDLFVHFCSTKQKRLRVVILKVIK